MNWPASIRGKEDWWSSHGSGNGWATCIVIGFLFAYKSMGSLLRRLMHLFSGRSFAKASSSSGGLAIKTSSSGPPNVTEADLQRLFTLLDADSGCVGAPWTPVVDKHNDSLSYRAKLREPKDGSPTEYLSTSTFRNCSCKLLKDFYMDSEYRLGWDKTFESYKMLHTDERTGYEIGWFIRRFPFVRSRDYVLAWRVWEGDNGEYYYFAKNCEHPQAPRTSMYSRVEHYMSGWRIRKDGDNCEIKMWHQEDTTSMAKMAFSCRIWSYMCDMEKSLRKYRPNTGTVLLQIPKVPAALLRTVSSPAVIESSVMHNATSRYKKRRLISEHSGKLMANGMLVLGGAMICARSAPIGAKIAAVYAINKLVKLSPPLKPMQQHYTVL